MFFKTGTDFRKLPEEMGLDLLLGDSDCRVTRANNVTEPSARTQHGGVASILFPRLAGFCLDRGKDPTGLGRYQWTTVGTADRKTRIITAYRPIKPSRKKRTGDREGGTQFGLSIADTSDVVVWLVHHASASLLT
jgi:hypothetical protein